MAKYRITDAAAGQGMSAYLSGIASLKYKECLCPEWETRIPLEMARLPAFFQNQHAGGGKGIAL
jgi:hypothetical protein